MQATQALLQDFYTYLLKQRKQMIGYPSNQSYNFENLYKFFELSINNIGDPLSEGPYKLKAHKFEKEVVEFLADLVGVEGDNFWGYVTNGGTEGNMYGLYIAREIYPNSIVYYSQEAHYSIQKILKLLKMPSIAIKTYKNGEIDIEDLERALSVNRTKTPIILATIGTTVKSGFDNLPKIKNLLKDYAFTNHYIHCDAALGGMILPFCDDAFEIGLKSGVHSISVSGHKMFGSPMPCGIVLARKDYVDKIASSVEYIGALDTTLSGSRNGHTTLLLWYAIQKNQYEGYKKIVEKCLKNAQFAVQEFNKIGIKAWRNKFSNTVVIPKPSRALLEKWQLAHEGKIAHIITMPHIDQSDISKFISDYAKDISTS
ncbi:MAG: histidine decarboxylase [Bacteriovoracaceae bacterium]|jgi:histidine decarboxylase|nr:histidine decarboxylase [Bacteriovoracaceae bacterium]